MTLNWVECLLVDNPVRALVQRRFEASLLFDLGGAAKAGAFLKSVAVAEPVSGF
jgi:hypothetical protein